jgi:hypothetical protein
MISNGQSMMARLNAVELEKAIKRYVNELGLSLPSIVKQTFRLIIQDAVKFTPPKTQAQGRKAVARDISNSMFLIDYRKIQNFPNLREAARKKDVSAVQAIIRNMRNGNWDKLTVKPFDESLHTSARDRRGRVRRKPRVAVLDGTAHRAYVRKIQGHVGWTKKGWGPSAAVAGITLPGWVMRHAGADGSVKDNTHLTDKPHIIGTHGQHHPPKGHTDEQGC